MWYLLLNNLKGRKAHNAVIVTAVALALTVGLVASLMAENVSRELVHKQLLLGPELAVVPPGTKQTGHIYLTKGPPPGRVAFSAEGIVQSFLEVEAMSPQTLVGTADMDGVNAMLILFDPETDFMVLPWLEKPLGLTSGARLETGIILGASLKPGMVRCDSLEIDGKVGVIGGRLRETGSFMDRSIFLPQPGNTQQGDPSWILLGVKQGVSVDMLINKLETHIPDIEVIARPEMLKTIHSQLYGVVQGGGLSAVAFLVVSGAFLVAGALFSLLIYERRREFGLLKAMGARNEFVFRLIVGEALVLGGMGAVFGLLLSTFWLVAGTGIRFGDVADLVPGHMALVLVLTAGVVVIPAMLPAVLAARMEPYAAIRAGE